jgi:hypothetical protein
MGANMVHIIMTLLVVIFTIAGIWCIAPKNPPDDEN